MRVTAAATAFADEVTRRFEFLTVRQRNARRAFDVPDIRLGADATTVVSVTYQMSPMIFRVCLVQADSGAQYVDLVVLVDFGDHIVEKPIAHESAATDRQMRRAVKHLAANVQATMK